MVRIAPVAGQPGTKRGLAQPGVRLQHEIEPPLEPAGRRRPPGRGPDRQPGRRHTARVYQALTTTPTSSTHLATALGYPPAGPGVDLADAWSGRGVAQGGS